jgi:hypothetical protein
MDCQLRLICWHTDLNNVSLAFTLSVTFICGGLCLIYAVLHFGRFCLEWTIFYLPVLLSCTTGNCSWYSLPDFLCFLEAWVSTTSKRRQMAELKVLDITRMCFWINFVWLHNDVTVDPMRMTLLILFSTMLLVCQPVASCLSCLHTITSVPKYKPFLESYSLSKKAYILERK